MAITYLGNHPQTKRGNATGFGTGALPNHLSWVGVIASAADDEAIIALSDIGERAMDQGICIQSNIALEYQVTLSPQEVVKSKDPNVLDAIIWSPAETLTPNEVTKLGVFFTAIKIKFPANGQCFIAH